MNNSLVKRIPLSRVANKLSEIQKLVLQGYTFIVVNAKENKEIFTISPINSQAIAKSDDFIEIGHDESAYIPLTEEEKKNPYEVFNQDPTKFNIPPIARFATDR